MSDQLDLQDISERASNYEPVTREEAEFLVRSQGRPCKGPKKPGVEHEYAKMRSVAGMVGGEDKGYSIAFMDSVLREGCGYDFNNIIMAYPLDGADHSDLSPFGGPDKSAKCPECGQSISFRSPYFNLVD